MPELRTQEQIDADERMREAVENCMKAYHPEHADEYTLTDAIVLTSMQKIIEHDIVVTRHPMFLTGGDMPWYKILGMLAIHELQSKKGAAEGNDNG